jgi:nuclear pore complex protein Nup85
MAACGDLGLNRADEILLRVPIPLTESIPEKDVQAMDAEDSLQQSVPPVLKDVIKTCFEYRREHVRRMVCSVCLFSFFL